MKFSKGETSLRSGLDGTMMENRSGNPDWEIWNLPPSGEQRWAGHKLRTKKSSKKGVPEKWLTEQKTGKEKSPAAMVAVKRLESPIARVRLIQGYWKVNGGKNDHVIIQSCGSELKRPEN